MSAKYSIVRVPTCSSCGARIRSSRSAGLCREELDPIPAVLSAFIDHVRARYGVEPVCPTPGVSASAYYQRAGCECSERSLEDERLPARIRTVHKEHSECSGYPRVWHQLQRQCEPSAGPIARYSTGCDHAACGREPCALRSPTPPRRSALIANRDFTASAHDRLRVGVLTYLRTWEGACSSRSLSTFSRLIVGGQRATHMGTRMVLDALRMAHGSDSTARRCLSRRIPTRARYTRARTTRSCSTIPLSSRRWAASETAMTTRSANRSSTATRPS